MKTTNRKFVATHLAGEAGFFLTKESHIKLSSVDKDYFELAEREVIARFDKWDDCIFWLKGYLMAKGGVNV